ncbi:phage antirepressor KilAC domain-containing protein [Variovorax sp. J22R133]|uniref:phage antirepressor KilAC domain-containing protein n=1 Tax=Variovorax brevis TaxID=3053503 RepID=UPI002575089A|nr:phage antirepressor KilAC domain-containing protein [Variovorax sp. J22R133]MDM0113926.1 phage antirepressor KilAC domain-containing protein [Variovorax sp. J22R133]
MSSREIARVTRQEHRKVKADIRTLLIDLYGETGALLFQSTQCNSQNGVPYPVYLLPKLETFVLASRYGSGHDWHILDRWYEMETGVPVSMPRLWGFAMKQFDEQIDAGLIALRDDKDAIAVIKKQYAGAFMASFGNKGLREVCMLLGADEHDFVAWLQSAGIMYRLGCERLPYSIHLSAGFFVVEAGPADESMRATIKAKFTPEGFVWIAGQWAKHQVYLAKIGGAI